MYIIEEALPEYILGAVTGDSSGAGAPPAKGHIGVIYGDHIPGVPDKRSVITLASLQCLLRFFPLGEVFEGGHPHRFPLVVAGFPHQFHGEGGAVFPGPDDLVGLLVAAGDIGAYHVPVFRCGEVYAVHPYQFVEFITEHIRIGLVCGYNYACIVYGYGVEGRLG